MNGWTLLILLWIGVVAQIWAHNKDTNPRKGMKVIILLEIFWLLVATILAPFVL